MELFNCNKQLQALANGDITKFDDRLNITEPKKFDNIASFQKHCLSIDLCDFLGVSKNCQCIFHDDKKSSASISKINGDYIYTCHSSHCIIGKSINLIGIIKNIFSCSYIQSLIILSKILNCEVNFEATSTEVKEKIENIIENNTEIINELKQFAPTASKIIGSDIDIIYCLYNITKEHICFCNNFNELIIGESTRYIQSQIGNQKKVSRALAIFAYLGIIRRIPNYEISTNRVQNAIYLSKNRDVKVMRIVTQVAINQLLTADLQSIEESALRWKANGYIKKSFTYENVYQKESILLAHRLFPQA